MLKMSVAVCNVSFWNYRKCFFTNYKYLLIFLHLLKLYILYITYRVVNMYNFETMLYSEQCKQNYHLPKILLCYVHVSYIVMLCYIHCYVMYIYNILLLCYVHCYVMYMYHILLCYIHCYVMYMYLIFY